MPSLKKVIQTASRGADLYFVFRFLRLLTAKWTSTNAYKLGIIDKKGNALKKSSDLTTTEEKASYTMLHRLTWKIRKLIEKVPLLGKSILLNYAAALFLLKEQKDPRIWTDEGYMKRKLMEFIETDWETDAQLLKEEVDNMEKKSFQFLREATVETEASTFRDRKYEKKKKSFTPMSQKKKRWGSGGYGKGTEEVEVDEATVLQMTDVDQWTHEIYKGLKSGWKSVAKSTLGGDENVAIMIKVTVEPEKDWPNKILHNAKFGMIRIATDGTMEMFASGHKIKNMRKTKVRSAKDVVTKINKWINTVSEEVEIKSFSEFVEIDEGIMDTAGFHNYPKRNKVGDEIEKIASKGGTDKFNLSKVASELQKGRIPHKFIKKLSPKSKKAVHDIMKDFGWKELPEEVELDEMFFRISIPDLPPVFVEGDSESKIRRNMKLKLRPDVFKGLSVERVSRADMAKKYRSLAKAEKEKEEDEIEEEFNEVAPPGWEGTVKKMKNDKSIDNPWALAWWMKSKGYKPNANEEVWYKEQKALEEDFVSNNMGSGNIEYRSPLLFSKKKQKLVKRKYPAGTMMAYEEVELDEADYKYDGKVVKISKKNFRKVHKDFKNSTKGKERMMINDPKTGGSISVPVEFTEEVEIQEVKNNWAVIDTAPSAVDRKKNEIMALATDEKDAHSSIKYSEGPRGYQSGSGKSKKTLKVVRIKKKHDIGDVFKEEVEMEEARKGKLPPHLAKFLDKKGNLKKDAADRVRKGRKERGAKITDRTPKGYGPNEEVEIEEGKFEKGDIVIPNMGPHKGDKHKIIHDFGDGSYNIKPLTHPRNIKYKLGASKAKEKQLKLVKDDSTHKQEIKSKIIDDSYHGTFAGKDVFIVDSDTFHTCRLGKQKYHRYEKYVGNGKIGQAIREFGLANPKKPIILQNGEDGPMLYLRYGGSKRYA